MPTSSSTLQRLCCAGSSPHVLALAVTAALGPSLVNILLAVGIVFTPLFALFVTVLAINFAGDGLRRVLDPRLRGRP